jgi:hypothetical protein
MVAAAQREDPSRGKGGNTLFTPPPKINPNYKGKSGGRGGKEGRGMLCLWYVWYVWYVGCDVMRCDAT